MENIKFRFGANVETIKDGNDLIYLESYAYFNENSELAQRAREMFDENGNVKEVDEYLKEQRRVILAEKYRKQANINKKFSKRTFENYNVENAMQKNAKEKALNYAQNIAKNIEDGKNILFIGQGSVGTGKTHLACAIANNILDNGFPVKVLNVISLVDELKSFDDSKRKELRNVDVLLIDDLGKENGTVWLCSEIYGIINARYENELPTIITIEGGLSDLENNYVIDVDGRKYNNGRSMVSRLLENCVTVKMQGDDYRLTKGAICK